nr:MAG TPA: winged helix-turn-helix transcription repressor [Crassvirales sp.]
MNVTITPNSSKVISVLLYNDDDYKKIILDEFNVEADDKRLQFLVILGLVNRITDNAIRLLTMIASRGNSSIGHLLIDDYMKTYSVSSFVYYIALNELIDKGFVIKDSNDKKWIRIESKYVELMDRLTNDSIVAIHF